MTNPTTLVEQFDGDAGAFSVTGPERYDDGLWLEEATTNTCTNPSAESGVTGINVGGNATVESVDDTFGSGAKSFHVEFDGTNGAYVAWPAASTGTAGDQFTCTAKLRGTGSVNAILRIWDTGYGAFTDASDTIALDPGGVDVELHATAPGGYTVIDSNFYLLSDDPLELWADSVQAEKKSYATSYTDTTRAASSASLDPTGVLDPASGAIAFWATRQVDTGSEEYWIICGSGGSGKDLLFASLTNDHLDHKWNCDNAGVDEDNSGADFPVGVPTFFYMGWAGTDTFTKQGGVALQSSTRHTPAGDFAGDFTLECSAGGVIFHEFAMFDRPLTDSELATLEGTQSWSLETLSSGSNLALARFRLCSPMGVG